MLEMKLQWTMAGLLLSSPHCSATSRLSRGRIAHAAHARSTLSDAAQHVHVTAILPPGRVRLTRLVAVRLAVLCRCVGDGVLAWPDRMQTHTRTVLSELTQHDAVQMNAAGKIRSFRLAAPLCRGATEILAGAFGTLRHRTNSAVQRRTRVRVVVTTRVCLSRAVAEFSPFLRRCLTDSSRRDSSARFSSPPHRPRSPAG